jgi:hypothetical protein
MRFSGHETFAIREGWLYKGISALSETPNFFNDPYPADRLGVGNNMGKSIKHWLLSAGLAERAGGEGRKRGREIVLSKFGALVLKHDPYFNSLATWCFIHINLVHSDETTACWNWFLTNCADSIFARSDAQEQFHRWAKYEASRQPSPTTLHKDLNCFLASYAQKVPPEKSDAEEATDCPLWELGLITYYRGSQRFRANRGFKPVPAHAIGFALSSSVPQNDNRKKEEISFEDAAALNGGPGKSFLMGPGALYECVDHAVTHETKCPISIGSQVGQRTIIYNNIAPYDWAEAYYTLKGQS